MICWSIDNSVDFHPAAAVYYELRKKIEKEITTYDANIRNCVIYCWELLWEKQFDTFSNWISY